MSIENINAKIIAEAMEYSRDVVEEAQKTKDDIMKEARDQAEKIRIKSQIKANQNTELTKSRKRSVAALEVRKLKLQAMQDMISRSFDLALDKLAGMEEDEYLEMLSSAVLKVGGEGGELLLNERDRGRLGEKLVKKVNDAAEIGTISLSADVIQAKGGFILKRGSTEINSTLETMVNEIKEATIPEVVEVLYGSQGE